MSFLLCCFNGGGSSEGRRNNNTKAPSSSYLKQSKALGDDKDRPLLQHEHLPSSTEQVGSNRTTPLPPSSSPTSATMVAVHSTRQVLVREDETNQEEANQWNVATNQNLYSSATESNFLDDEVYHNRPSYTNEEKESMVDQYYSSTSEFKIPMHSSSYEEEEYFDDDEHHLMIDHQHDPSTGVHPPPPQTNKNFHWTSQYHQSEEDEDLGTESASPPEETFDESEYIDDDDEIFQQYYVSVVDNIDMTIVELECRNNRERDNKRMRIIKELKKTECNYLKTLETLQTYYLDPLKDGKNNIVSKDFFQKTVGELSVIYGINQLFFQKLSELIDIPEEDEDEKAMYEYIITKSYDMEVKLANEIVLFSQALKLYTGFITKYKNSLDQLNSELERNKRLQRFIKQAFKSIQLAGMNPAPPSSYLIAPIQRIPRYQLLLSELTKNSAHYPELHEKYLQATESITKVAEYCNEKEREVQNLARSFSISRKIRSRSIIQPSRKYMDECSFDFKKKSRKGSLTAYLFSDVLVLTEKSMMQQKTKKLIFSKEMPISLEEVGEHGVAICQGNNKYWTLIIDPTSSKQRQFISLLKQRCKEQ
ncbi:hypothetical protein C9374_011912 [Naegleria lovaniensis]|uniref:DH domain-containing protein n=1 Tax=Naegleria lovaniensis TaxID=51637 RepID=A0AA88KCV7_NAELO|nr:uncharacterized protein C9374_011912 [Naegleria lovaniensis]KAG2373623.1 hypothetical protein C9374_011912 [Naegleria lovaniensis]